MPCTLEQVERSKATRAAPRHVSACFSSGFRGIKPMLNKGFRILRVRACGFRVYSWDFEV